MVEQEYDIIITDLGLGEHSGWEVAEAAKVVRPGAGVVLATAWAADWNQEEIRRRGVDAILSKPYTVDEVLVCLEQALVKSV
jgi:CheY-like chemotaxis protein